MNDSVFIHTQDQLKQLAATCLAFAREQGGTDAAVEISEGSGLSVIGPARQDRDDRAEQGQGHGRDGLHRPEARQCQHLRLFPAALRATVDAAYNIARFTAEDDCAGLADADMLEMAPRDLRLCYPWQLSTEQAVALAQRAEGAAFDVDPRITNSEGASVHVQQSHFVAANSRGFSGGYPFSRHTLSVAPIAGKGAKMQRDDWYTSVRDPAKMAAPEAVGRYAAERALARLNAASSIPAPARCCSRRRWRPACSAPSCRPPRAARCTASRASCSIRLGKSVFPVPHPGAGRPARGRRRRLGPVRRGRRAHRQAPMSSRTASCRATSCLRTRRASWACKTTGNAGGSHNLSLTSSSTKKGDDFAGMLRKMGRGLLVTELMGQGTNYVTGDYSRGASGFWVENGVIQYPVEEITIAGNMKDMFQQIVAVGNDVLIRGNKQTGSILIENMVVADRHGGQNGCILMLQL
jgi:PmbA protein